MTVVLNMQSIAMPQITNPIRVDVATQANPTAIVQTQTDNTAGHPARIWTFPGLPRTNYTVVMNEIAGGTPVNQLAYFDVVPDNINITVRQDEQLVGGVTPGFTAGLKQVFFDGHDTGGGVLMPDYRGWNINPERRAGRGTMQRGVEYNWNADTGQFDWLQTGDQILPNELYNIDFDPIATDAGGSVTPPTTTVVVGFTTRLITASASILDTDLGNNIIVEPAGSYLELTLPNVATMKDGLPVSISIYKTSTCCVKIIGISKFEYGASMFLIGGESVRIYCFVRSAGNNEWRYRDAKAAWETVGRLVYSDGATPINAVPANGTQCDVLTYARLWQWVQALSANNKVAYTNWSINQTFFSDTNGSSFYVPNRKSLYPRITNTGEYAGNLMLQQLSSHKHATGYNPRDGAPFGDCGFTNKFGDGSATDNDNDWWYTNDATEIAGSPRMNPSGLIGGETRPNSFLTNSYILL